ncbi:baeRF12 domain-containing protein [Acidocella aromatica]|uniref:Protein required for attachment to host cells n=1 Tax=Acidocella aromatica TaxID=1303579 RepID=A0A840VF39_9PROT|nr:host attachment protein [Acidocella aromatica]MBB5374306.1 protein required for attachment to host cells [Acidocella aromatica]
MSIHLKVLFALANGEHARFVRPTEDDNTLHSSSRVNPAEGHEGAANHPHAQDREKFAAWVAEQLNHDVSTYDELVLVAPAHTLTTIREHLSKQAAAKMAGTVEKDLVKISDHDLWPHVREWVRPVHRQKVM